MTPVTKLFFRPFIGGYPCKTPFITIGLEVHFAPFPPLHLRVEIVEKSPRRFTTPSLLKELGMKVGYGMTLLLRLISTGQ